MDMSISPLSNASDPLRVRPVSILPSGFLRLAVARETLAGRVRDSHIQVSALLNASLKKPSVVDRWLFSTWQLRKLRTGISQKRKHNARECRTDRALFRKYPRHLDQKEDSYWLRYEYSC